MKQPLAPRQVDLPVEQARVVRMALLAFVVCAAILVPVALWLPRWIAFPSALDARLGLVLRADIIVALWVVVAVRRVSETRFESKADNAGSAFGPPSARLAVRAAFLQNTLEQAFIAVLSHLSLATVAGEAPLPYVLGSVILFCIGRATFLIGYPHGAGGRAFGMVTTVLPALGAYAWVIFAIIADHLRGIL